MIEYFPLITVTGYIIYMVVTELVQEISKA
jgi:hypothetical protein